MYAHVPVAKAEKFRAERQRLEKTVPDLLHNALEAASFNVLSGGGAGEQVDEFAGVVVAVQVEAVVVAMTMGKLVPERTNRTADVSGNFVEFPVGERAARLLFLRRTGKQVVVVTLLTVETALRIVIIERREEDVLPVNVALKLIGPIHVH